MNFLKDFDKDDPLGMPALNMESEDSSLDLDLKKQWQMFHEANEIPAPEKSDAEEEQIPDNSEIEQTAETIETEASDADEISDDEDNDENEKPKKRVNWRKSLLIYAHDVLYLLAILIVVSLFLRVVVVSGTSMTNTLKDGDYLLVLSNVFYRNPDQGDIIVVSKSSFDDGKPIVKRVIATEGQTVDIDFDLGVVYVDGIALDEPYTKTPTTLQEGVTFPLVVEEDCVFVLGDNRNGSRDSRYPDIGQIHEKEIIGKVLLIFLPGTNGTDIYGNPNEPRDFSRIGVPD